MDGSRRMRPGRATVRAGALAGAVVLLTSCGSTSTVAPTASMASASTATGSTATVRPARSAREAVTGYLSAVNTHDAAAAYGYLAPEYPQDLVGAIPQFTDWVANVASARVRPMPPGVSGAGIEAQYPLYRDLIEFAVDYDITFRTESVPETSGPHTRFFIVGRSRAQGSWQILSIGTGP